MRFAQWNRCPDSIVGFACNDGLPCPYYVDEAEQLNLLAEERRWPVFRSASQSSFSALVDHGGDLWSAGIVRGSQSTSIIVDTPKGSFSFDGTGLGIRSSLRFAPFEPDPVLILMAAASDLASGSFGHPALWSWKHGIGWKLLTELHLPVDGAVVVQWDGRTLIAVAKGAQRFVLLDPTTGDEVHNGRLLAPGPFFLVATGDGIAVAQVTFGGAGYLESFKSTLSRAGKSTMALLAGLPQAELAEIGLPTPTNCTLELMNLDSQELQEIDLPDGNWSYPNMGIISDRCWPIRYLPLVGDAPVLVDLVEREVSHPSLDGNPSAGVPWGANRVLWYESERKQIVSELP